MCYDKLGNRLLTINKAGTVVGQFDCSTGAYTAMMTISNIKDSFGDSGWAQGRQIEVDPQNSDAVYVGIARQVYANEYGVLKITNGGKTYTNLTSTRNNVYPGDDGGRQVTRLCINPVTRHLFAGGGCRGIFKLALDQ